MESKDASQTINIEKTRTDIESLEREIADLKNKIGESYWSLFAETGRYEPSLREIFKGIQERLDKITAMELDIQMAEDGENQLIQPPIRLQLDRVICHACGTINDSSARTCLTCGAKLKEEVSGDGAGDYGACPLCGADLSGDAVFCYTCGARIKI